MTNFIASLLTVLVGGGLFAFIEFLIQRRDKKHDALGKITKEMGDIRKEIKALADRTEAEREEDLAMAWRLRILDGAEQCALHIKHSQEWWGQIIEDVDHYEKYCKVHDDFINGKAKASSDLLRRTYAERVEHHDFL